MAVRLDVREDFRDLAVFADDEGRARHTHVFLAHHGSFHPNTIGLADLFILIGDEGEGQFEFTDEFVVGGG